MKYQLGEWTVEERANLLTRGGEDVRVEKRVMAVLMQLIGAEGSVVSKDELLDAVWNGAVVSDHSLANAVSDLRRALRDDRRDPRYIETIPKRGYRLLMSAYPVEDAPNESFVKKMRVITAGDWTPLAVIAATIVLVAALALWILPRPGSPPRLVLKDIENAAGSAEWDIAGHTAAEMLAVTLADGRFRLVRWRAVNPAAPAAELNLHPRDRLLEGSIVLDAGAPVLTLQLIDPGDGASIWAGAYALDQGRFGDLARTIVADLAAPLGLQDASETYAAADPSVIEDYWRARYLWSLREHGAIREALRILTDIVARAPDYAPAHAALADIYAHKTAEELDIDRAETYALADEHLAAARAIDPDLGEAFVSSAYLKFFRDRDRPGAMADINAAIAAAPSNALAWQTKAMIASAAGDAGESLAAVSRARALDPLSASILWDRVWFLYVAGRYDEALKAAAEARRVSAPVHIYEALIQLALGDDLAAFKAWLARAQEMGLNDERAADIWRIHKEQGARAGLAALADAMESDAGYAEYSVPRAAFEAALGRRDAAVATLLGDGPREKSWWWSWYPVIPAFDDVRGDPALGPIAARLGESAS